jgi:DNA-binding MarR family transcriptional regulator
MKRRIQAELKQSKPFATLEEEVCVEVQRTAQVVVRWIAEALKPSGLTLPQFNVLRILRGARPDALSSSAIAERMVAYDPDVTRLLDRLEAAGLVEKARDTRDRRVMNVRATEAGIATVEAASLAVRRRLQQVLGAVGPRKLETLANLLEQVRGTPD